MTDKEQLNAVFSLARERTESVSFEEMKEVFLNSTGPVLSQTKSKFWSSPLSKGLLMVLLTIIVGAMIFVVLSRTNNQVPTMKKNKDIPVLETGIRNTISPKVLDIEKDKEELINKSRNVERINSLLTKPINSLPVTTSFKPNLFQKRLVSHSSDRQLKQHENYRFPKLTDKEIKANNRTKKKLIANMGLFFKDRRQPHFEGGTFTMNDSIVVIKEFLMERGEVSNRDYRVFLFDLLIQNKLAEFRLAEPHQELWTELLGDSMHYFQMNYFSNEKYDSYPVVNVTRKGAEMYCAWVTAEVEKIFKEYPEYGPGTFRLPQKKEWLYAATGKGTLKEAYPWNSDSTIKGGCFRANYKLDKNELIDVECRRTSKSDGTAFTTAGYITGKEYITAFTHAYNSTPKGLYNLCGNVAEMIFIGKTPGTIGGGWMNTAEEIKFDAEDLHKGLIDGHPNVGFRIIRVDYKGEPR